jgi:hypothetical protein
MTVLKFPEDIRMRMASELETYLKNCKPYIKELEEIHDDEECIQYAMAFAFLMSGLGTLQTYGIEELMLRVTEIITKGYENEKGHVED